MIHNILIKLLLQNHMGFISNRIQIICLIQLHMIMFDNIEFIHYNLKQCDIIYKPYVAGVSCNDLIEGSVLTNANVK